MPYPQFSYLNFSLLDTTDEHVSVNVRHEDKEVDIQDGDP